MIDAGWVVDLFGSHVGGGAHDLSGDGGCCGDRNFPAPYWTFLSGFFIRRGHHFRDPEVRDLHAALAVQQDVLRLDVAVDDAAVVGVLERVADPRDDGERLARGQAFALEQLAQVHAIDELHQEEKQVAAAAEFVERDDSRVVEFRQCAGLAGKTFGKRGIAGDGGGQDFQGDDPVEFGLPRLVNRAHAAAANEFEDFQRREKRREFLDRGRDEGGVGGVELGIEGSLL